MVPRSLAMAGLLGAAVGVPYAVNNAPEGWSTGLGGGGTPAPARVAADPSIPGPGTPLGRVTQVPLSTLLHWGITKEWVYAHWDRKTTGLADPRLFGVRAAVITGGQMTDVAGAISYYFDNAGVLQRIRLHGRTADTTELLRIAAAQGMQGRPPQSPGDQFFQAVERRGQVRSQLRTRPESVIRRADPRSSFVVDLELNRPGSDYWVDPVAPRLPEPLAGANPQAAGPDAAANAGNRRPDGTPILPIRSVVPDAGAAGQPSPATASKDHPAVQPSQANLQPVYRDELRWPH